MSGERSGLAAGSLRVLTWFGSIPYGFAVYVRNKLYDQLPSWSSAVDVPVISIGNITAGGTGKTPMVAWLARRLREKGIRVSLISRGYRADERGLNDEALELEQQLPDVPHVQNPDRLQAATVVIDELATQCILLDDGFQHRRLRRDLDIVLIDATCPFGYDQVLPRGLLRESLSGLCRAQVLILTRADAVDSRRRNEIRERAIRFAPNARWAEAIHAPSELVAHQSSGKPIEALVDRSVLLISAIGNPLAFHETVRQCGAKIVASRTFTDHHQYDREDLCELRSWVSEFNQIDYVICTRKDLVKLQVDQLEGIPLMALAIEMQLTVGEDAVLEIVDQVLLNVDTVDDMHA